MNHFTSKRKWLFAVIAVMFLFMVQLQVYETFTISYIDNHSQQGDAHKEDSNGGFGVQEQQVNRDCLSAEESARALGGSAVLLKCSWKFNKGLPEWHKLFSILAIALAVVLIPYLVYQNAIILRQERLIIRWKVIGYIHQIDGKKKEPYSNLII